MKTKRVRIAVVSNENGDWCAEGFYKWNDETTVFGAALHIFDPKYVEWIEVDIQISESTTVEGEVCETIP